MLEEGLVALHTIVLLLHLYYHDDSLERIECKLEEGLHALEAQERISYATLVLATHETGFATAGVVSPRACNLCMAHSNLDVSLKSLIL